MIKKLLILVAVILLGWGAYHFYTNRKATPPVKIATNTTHPDPSDATFQFEDGPITLKDGSASSPIAPGSAMELDTTLTNDIAYGDLNNDGKTDTAVLLVQDGGGSGVFLYVAAYVSGNVAYKGTNAIFLGDRISPKTISIDNAGTINVTFLDRGPNDPMSADPTISTTKHFAYANGELVEK